MKLRFRSVPAPRPRGRWLARDLLLNMEDRTLVLGLRPLRTGHPVLRRLRLPRLGVQVHGDQQGIPLSIRRLRRLLSRHGVRVLGVEPDRGSLPDAFWVTARKAL